jgi:hypothetical protein
VLYTLKYKGVDIKFGFEFSFDLWRSRGRMLKLISETWSRGPSLNLSRPDRGHPIILGSGPCHTTQYIRIGWFMNRGPSDHHHHSKKDPISLCGSDEMHHCPYAKSSSPVSCSFHYTGAAFESRVTTSPMVRASSP